MTVQNIAGEWQGRYSHDQFPKMGANFTAFFSETSGSLGGTIVDDDGSGGKATVIGSFSFPNVQFTKQYVKTSTSIEKKTETIPKFKIFNLLSVEQKIETTTTSTYGHPVEYEGLMSEDGKTLGGTWTIKTEMGVQSGKWTATKLLEDEEHKGEQTDVSKNVGRVKKRQLDEVL